MQKRQHFPGLIPQKDGTFAITTEFRSGILSSSALDVLSDIANRPDITVHITTAQKVMILGLDEAEGMQVLARLEDVGVIVRKQRDLGSPRVCVGKPWCRFAAQDTFTFADTLYNELARQPVPPKLKVAVSGCPACCSWANMMDLGFVGVTSGFKVMLGGHGGAKPVIGREICTITSPEDAVPILRRLAELFSANVKKKMRVDRMVKKLGLEQVKEYILEGVCIR